MNWAVLFFILGAVMGGTCYLVLLLLGCNCLGDLVEDVTGSVELGWVAYMVSAMGGLVLPLAIGVALYA